MKKIFILLGFLILGGVASNVWAQSIVDITWTPASPAPGEPVRFVVKVVNPGPKAQICIRLLTPKGSPESQTHPGIGIRKDPPINVAFNPVTYSSAGEFEAVAQIMDDKCEKLLVGIPYRTERLTIKERKPKPSPPTAPKAPGK
ncbi:MAG: hypothetical protein ACE144_02710 [Thermodesulfobacteriota bacterium]